MVVVGHLPLAALLNIPIDISMEHLLMYQNKMYWQIQKIIFVIALIAVVVVGVGKTVLWDICIAVGLRVKDPILIQLQADLLTTGLFIRKHTLLERCTGIVPIGENGSNITSPSMVHVLLI